MNRRPLWIGEVDIVRAIFGHAANADLERLRRIWPGDPVGRITDAVLEPRLGRRRLDLLVSAGDRADGRPGRWLVVEAKVGAVVDAGTLADYLASAAKQHGPSAGLLVAPYEPVGALPSGWRHRDLADVADQLSCPASGRPACAVCEEIGYAVSESVSSPRVAEWRSLTDATRQAAIPSDWTIAGGGSSVGRPLVWFQSPWLDHNEDSYVQVEVGNRFGLPAASAMLVAQAASPGERVAFPDRLWSSLALGAAAAPALATGVIDGSSRSRGARDRRVAGDARRNAVPPTWSLGYDMKGWHGRGRVIRHSGDDYGALLPAAIGQGIALYEVARQKS